MRDTDSLSDKKVVSSSKHDGRETAGNFNRVLREGECVCPSTK